jgi:hypothetical protein
MLTMAFPIVIELPRALAPVSGDTFLGTSKPPAAPAPVPSRRIVD